MKLALDFEELDTFEITVDHPARDEPIGGLAAPFTVELYALHSDYMKRIIDARQDAKTAKAARLKKPELANFTRSDYTYFYAKAHKSWKNVPVEEGKPQPACNETNAVDLLNGYEWYRRFIGNALGNDLNAIKSEDETDDEGEEKPE